MKLSKETAAIFKNFASINTNLTLKEGNTITTISTGKNIIAEATVDESFDEEFGIYDLNEFLGAMSLFGDPDLTFDSKAVTIKEGKRGIKYYGASTKVLTSVPTIKAFPEPDIEFVFTGEILQQIQRASSILKAADFSVIGDGTIVSISVGDKSNPTSNTYDCEIGTTDKVFRVNFKVENLKLLPGDYNVAIGAKKISRFKSTTQPLTYYVAIELDSTFDF
jgi:hypothetical protein